MAFRERHARREQAESKVQKAVLIILLLATTVLSACKRSERAGAPLTGGPDRTASNVELYFTNAPLSQVLDFYAQLSGRTVLMSSLPQVSITLKTSAQSKEEAIRVLDDALKQQLILAIPDGDRFVRIIMESDKQKDESRAARLKSAPPRFPAGAKNPAEIDINFPNVGIESFIVFYGALVGAKYEPDPAHPVPNITLSLRTLAPLTKAEALHAMDTLLAWNGLEAVPSTNGRFKVVLISQP